MRGKFIVFEGIDGCGKGTQIKLATSFIFDLSKDNDVLLTREPTRDCREIRQRMSEGTDVKEGGSWYSDKFVEDRKNHLKKYILPSLDNGTHVLTDRYKPSTLTYQALQGIPFEQLMKAHEGLLVPDLTIIYDCPAEIAFERRKKDGAKEVFDKVLEFQEKLRHAYLALPDKLSGENIVIIDANRPIDDVFRDTKRVIRAILPE